MIVVFRAELTEEQLATLAGAIGSKRKRATRAEVCALLQGMIDCAVAHSAGVTEATERRLAVLEALDKRGSHRAAMYDPTPGRGEPEVPPEHAGNPGGYLYGWRMTERRFNGR